MKLIQIGKAYNQKTVEVDTASSNLVTDSNNITRCLSCGSFGNKEDKQYQLWPIIIKFSHWMKPQIWYIECTPKNLLSKKQYTTVIGIGWFRFVFGKGNRFKIKNLALENLLK